LGIGTAAYFIGNKLVRRTQPGSRTAPDNTDSAALQPKQSTFKKLISYQPVQLAFCCALGSMLPDIIDKPVGHLFFSGFFHSNGRIFSHTLIFLLLVLAVGLAVYFISRSRAPETSNSKLKTGNYLGLVTAFGVFMHLVEDQMWQTPQTLLWPFQGWAFPPGGDITAGEWLSAIWQGLLSDPTTLFSEIIGFLFTVYVVLMIVWSVRKMRNKTNTNE
jgi:hypothetical protein